MTTINIFLTSDIAHQIGRFAHDDLVLEFAHLEGEEPKRLIDGPIWAFVDWVLPEYSGLELCRRLRANPKTAPAHITMVLESNDPDDRRRALKAGADDYIVGPLDRANVIDRVLSVHSSTLTEPPRRLLRLGDLTLDPSAFQARYKSAPISLMPNEFRLLRYFMENPGTVFSRAQLIGALGKQEPALDARTVDVWVGRLRRALKLAGCPHRPRTVRMMGYVLDQP